MRKITRKPETAPNCLTKQVIEDERKKPPVMRTAHELYTEKWIKKRKNDKSVSFEWYNDLNHDLQPLLKAMTCNHCSFCDSLHNEDIVEHGLEIEHFKSKTDFEHLAYKWTNLFIICRNCNGKKGDKNEPLLLKPDEKEYQFDRNFSFNLATYTLEPKNEAAKVTIEVYDLNRAGLRKARKTELKDHKNAFIKKRIDDYGFRDLLELKQQSISFQDLLDLEF
jgi:5-methylcytosine-specific restriction endonuclease McrA